MVSKIKLLLLPVLFSVNFSYAQDRIEFTWLGDKSEKCQKIVAPFLQELRSLANDTLVEINSSKSRDESKINLSCEVNAITIQDRKYPDDLKIHYLGEKAGFDSLDWIVLQKRYFGANANGYETISHLRPAPSTGNLSAINKNQTTINDSRKNEQKNTLLYGFIGIAAGALGGALLSPDGENIETNAIVFGAVGGLGGVAVANF